ncbi:hypothetical protein AAEO56_14915 [Flavobacterium sp. DGU11]|uniref:Por secretion system C-terminal sorting domain-containing protein n=1 Tax=Flavobacterium arundinis TaxID=3139143 RepID=A0ABU9HZH9_9FLAO
MKKVMKMGLVMALFLTALVANAADNKLSLNVRTGMGKLVNFTVNDIKTVNVTISAKDKEVLFSERLKSKEGKINRTYDLAAFPDGTYYLEAETGTEVATYEVTIANNGVIVSEKTVAEVYKPLLNAKDGMVTVTLPAGKTPVGIKMYDENNVELYNGTVARTTKFDMNSTTAKKITLVMTYNDKMFVETIAAR